MTHRYRFDRFMVVNRDLRAADADRERVAELLRKGHGEGRLDVDELQERLERCYRARTLGELDELVRDLPREEPGEPPSFGPSWPWRLAPLVAIFIAMGLLFAVAVHHVVLPVILLVFLLWRVSWAGRRPYRRRGWM